MASAPSRLRVKTNSASPSKRRRSTLATRTAMGIRLTLSAHLLADLARLVDGSHQVEGLLRQVVVLAFEDLAEPADGLLDRHVAALLAGELLGHEEGLGEEALDLAGA